MKFVVYHAKNPTFGMGNQPDFTEANFEKVAELDTVGLEDVFALTNHIDKPWWQDNKYLNWHKPGSRSTSVGDIVVDGAGCAFLCEGCGWKQLTGMFRVTK